jgi:tetrathionate reductase subunit B
MSDSTDNQISRRDLLKSTGAVVAGAAAAALPVGAAEAGKASKAPRWVMVMDLRRCIGCRACTVACKAENNVALGRFRTVIQEKTVGTFPDVTKTFLPIMCNHCEGNEEDKIPPCIKECPEYPGERAVFETPDGKKIRYRTGATYKRPDGMILLDNSQCIGCGKCIDACPYGVRAFDPFKQAGKKPEEHGITKCTFCQHLVDEGLTPACVTTCQGRARIFGDLNDPDSEVTKLIEEHGAKDNVLLPEEDTVPHVFYIDPDNVLAATYTKREPKKLDHFMDQIP